MKLKDKTIAIEGKEQEGNQEWIKAKAEELTPFFDNFVCAMSSFLCDKVSVEYFSNQIYTKTYGNINEFIDEKIQKLLANVQANYEIRKPFEIVMWAIRDRAEKTKEGHRDYYTLSAIACRLIDTYYYVLQRKEEDKNKDGHQIARMELKCRGYYGDKIRLECKQIYGDMG